MNNQEKINFRQVRDFGEIFNVSVKFLRQNFKQFFQALIFIAGPFVLISAIAGAFYQSNAVSIVSAARMGQSDVFSQFGFTYLIFIIAAITANLALIGTVFSYMINYMEKGPGGFTLNDVRQTLVSNIGNLLSVFFLMATSEKSVATTLWPVIAKATESLPTPQPNSSIVDAGLIIDITSSAKSVG